MPLPPSMWGSCWGPTRKNILCCRPFLVSLWRQPSRINSWKTDKVWPRVRTGRFSRTLHGDAADRALRPLTVP